MTNIAITKANKAIGIVMMPLASLVINNESVTNPKSTEEAATADERLAGCWGYSRSRQPPPNTKNILFVEKRQLNSTMRRDSYET